MSLREIVTLQIGHYSNFVGTHWWNLQESSFVYEPSELSSVSSKEINHDVLFREGHNRKGEVTYTPRLLLFDLKGSLNTLKQEGMLYEAPQEDEDIRWSGDITLHKAVSVPKNKFLADLDREAGIEAEDDAMEEHVEQLHEKGDGTEKEIVEAGGIQGEQIFGPSLYNLDDSVTVWSDFLRMHLHPKSIQIIEEYTHGNDLQAFDLFGCGQQVLSDYRTRCEWEDRLHYFLEDCDSLQGFHVLVDPHDGFGGLASSVLQYMEDEFHNKAIFTFGCTPATLSDDTVLARSTRIINSALAYNRLCMHSSLYTPLSLAQGLWRNMDPPRVFPLLGYKATHYHTSAVLAATLDTATAPYRFDNPMLHLTDLTNTFNTQGRKLSSLHSSLPFPLDTNSSLIDTLISLEEKFPWQPVTPHVKNESVPAMQSSVLRGIPTEKIKSIKSEPHLPSHIARCDRAEEVLQYYLTDRFPGAMNAGFVVRDPCRTGIPFPHIFRKEVGKDGLISSTQRQLHQGVESVPMMTSLQSSPDIAVMLSCLSSAAGRLNIKKHHSYLEMGLEEDDYRETVHSLESLGQNYVENG